MCIVIICSKFLLAWSFFVFGVNSEKLVLDTELFAENIKT